LAVALPKGERQKWLVEKLTELGVTRLVPLVAERGVAEPTPSAIERLKRGVIEASKQCGRNRLLELAPPRRAAELFADATLPMPRLIADPEGHAEIPARGEHTIVAVGPEGGFSSAERSAAETGHWQPVSLGPRILRIETAAVAVAVAISGQPAAGS
jgi:16S rRNA (uracil1498-N3)-methyltransferase